eukprot:TRINITY_DN102808_c0_g1_i1.p1 TRINITY_DN102808_c0_g1~~TRINITY_DN102808_c0_g1_i1.p1  ORF type:complete len:384 (-),score=58.80 TRINITY_DN102808_c0_g1_i1:237-1361(-)
MAVALSRGVSSARFLPWRVAPSFVGAVRKPCALFSSQAYAPKVAARSSVGVFVEKGEKRAWCTCGLSKNQPFCDGAHRAANEMHGVTPDTGGYKPLLWESQESKEYRFCQCKATGNPPFCDGSHRGLDENTGVADLPTEFHKWQVLSTEQLSHDTTRLRLKCEEAQLRKAAVSFHFSLRAAATDGSIKTRPYTPTQYDSDTREMDLVVKRYDNGMVSPVVTSMKAGDTVELRGPLPGEYSLQNGAGHTSIALFAGGTGITPILQIATAAKTLNAVPSIKVFSCNKSAGDILCKTEIDELGKEAHVKGVYHVLESESAAISGSFEGRLSAKILQETLPAPDAGSHAVICGPPLFSKSVAQLLQAHGYKAEQITIC